MRQIDPLVHSRSTCFAKSCERSGIERIQHGAFFLFFNYQRNAEHPNYFRDELWMKRPLLPEPICVVACTQFTATELGSTAIELPHVYLAQEAASMCAFRLSRARHACSNTRCEVAGQVSRHVSSVEDVEPH